MMRWITVAGSSVMLACALAGKARAQDSARAEVSRWIYPGSEEESYLRYLQTLGIVREYPWSVRAFSSYELRRLQPKSDDHPWANARALRARPILYKGVRAEVAPIEATTWYNTAFPFGMNDGAVWVGRGLTAEISAGASARWGPVELRLAPTAFWAENREFVLAPRGLSAISPYADPLFPIAVDRPQRFGNRAYSRLDFGQSSLQVDAAGVALGVSTANEWWGPMSEFPYVLGNNAPGFPHVFFGSSHPVNIFVGGVHARVLYAQLAQSAFSPETTSRGRRFAGGVIATFQPRGFPGLEVGATRFYNVAWPDSGLSSVYFTHLFETLLKKDITKIFAPSPLAPKSSTDNQLASAFARWTLARSGFELYGEYGREDHSADARDLLVEPNHSATYGVGARKAWRSGASILAVRFEVMNFETSSAARHRSEDGIYVHGYTRQGHTNRGQLLGTGIAVGNGAGSIISLERFDTRGFERVTWSRLLVQEIPGLGGAPDVQHVVRVERTFGRRGSSLQLRSALDGVYELNRNFGADKLNFRGQLGWAWHP
jgi:hypothetical protein